MAPDALDLIRDHLSAIDGRLERMENLLLADDEYTPKQLYDKLTYFVDHIKKIESRIEQLEAISSRLLGAIAFVCFLVVPLTAIFNPFIRKLLHLE